MASEEIKKSQADIIIEQAIAAGDVFFHNTLEEPYVAVDNGGFYTNYKVNDKMLNDTLK